MGLLTDRINNRLEKRNLINEHALNREPVPLKMPLNNITNVGYWRHRKNGALHSSHESMLVTYRQRQTLAATSRSLLKLLRDNKASAVQALYHPCREKRHYCCLVPRPHYSARPIRFGSRGPREGPLHGLLVI